MPTVNKFEMGISNEELLEILPRLLELQQGQAFHLYLDLLRVGMVQAREVGFDSGVDTFEYYKGLIEGLGQARNMVDMLVHRAADLVKREEAGASKKPAARQRDMESDTSF